MGLFGKTETKPEAETAPPNRAPQTRTARSEAPTVIGRDAVVKGEIASDRDMLIEGRVEGTIRGANRVIIGENGNVDALVVAEIVSVRGTVNGDCEGFNKVEIAATGKVFGNISAKAIVVAEGATFRGASKMAPPTTPGSASASTPSSESVSGGATRAEAPAEGPTSPTTSPRPH